MTLYQYLSENQIGKAQFARDLGIAESSLFKYINQEREPKLSIAIRIIELTKGEVTYRGLLKDEEEAASIVPKAALSKGSRKKANKKASVIDTDLL